MRWCHCGPCRVHVLCGLQLSREHDHRGQWVDGQLRCSVPCGVLLYCIDAPARVSSRHVQHWRDHVHICRDVHAMQCGHVRPDGAWCGWRYCANVRRVVRCGLLLPRRFDECKTTVVRGRRLLRLWRCAGAAELQPGLLLRRWLVYCHPVALQQLCSRRHVCGWDRRCVLLDTVRGWILLLRGRCPCRVHDVPRGVHMWWRPRCNLVLDDLSRGLLLPGEYRNDCLCRRIVQCYDGRELGCVLFTVHGCGGLLLPCSEHDGGRCDVPARILLHRGCRYCGCAELRGWCKCECGAVDSGGLDFVGCHLHSVLCWFLCASWHRSAAVSGGQLRELDGVDVVSVMFAVYCRCRVILRGCVDFYCRNRLPHRLLLRWWHRCTCRVRVHRGLQLSVEHHHRGQWVDGQLRHDVPRGILLCCIDAAARVPGRDAQLWWRYVYVRSNVPAMQCGHVWYDGAWRGWEHRSDLQRRLCRGVLLPCGFDKRKTAAVCGRRVLRYWRRAGSAELQPGLLLRPGFDDCIADPVL
jgi:hypothetical protein